MRKERKKLHNEDINNPYSSPNSSTGQSEMRKMGRKCSMHENREKVIERAVDQLN
jgi:hypothetical protein